MMLVVRSLWHAPFIHVTFRWLLIVHSRHSFILVHSIVCVILVMIIISFIWCSVLLYFVHSFCIWFQFTVARLLCLWWQWENINFLFLLFFFESCNKNLSYNLRENVLRWLSSWVSGCKFKHNRQWLWQRVTLCVCYVCSCLNTVCVTF